jgi:hypothetical protein
MADALSCDSGFSLGKKHCNDADDLPDGAQTPSTVASASDIRDCLLQLGEIVQGLVFNTVKWCNLCRYGRRASGLANGFANEIALCIVHVHIRIGISYRHD